MNVSEIMVDKVYTLNPEDNVSKALSLMSDNDINQIPLVDDSEKYVGMIFAKHFIDVNALQHNSKLKNFLVNTPVLEDNDSIERAAQLMVGTGIRALPVKSNGKLKGILSETDVVLTSDFGNSIADEVMSGAIVIERNTTIGNALAKMRRYNISRLPVINKDGILEGNLNSLDICKILATPRERAGKSPGTGTMATIRDIQVKDIMRRAVSVERGTPLNKLVENFKKADEIVIVGNKRPIGIVTPKDALELILPKKSRPSINIAHIDDDEARREIQDQMTKFMKKIEGLLDTVQLVTVYADKHRTRKYSFRARIITGKGVIDAKAVGYDPISTTKDLVSKLDRIIKAEHSQKIEKRTRRESSRRAL